MLIPAAAPGPSPVSLAGAELVVREEAIEDIEFVDELSDALDGGVSLVEWLDVEFELLARALLFAGAVVVDLGGVLVDGD